MPEARELGWDDGLYEEGDGQHAGPAAGGQHAGPAAGQRGAATDGQRGAGGRHSAPAPADERP
ncbi:hypothetical protein AAHZ94_33390, partial [Streptomyces sp. HSW2009]|uniref:hypothetical protein n=1 Tax=Streptomyces sp. HSW2009 TaxID=3142890 RepID=UPI0032EBF4E6